MSCTICTIRFGKTNYFFATVIIGEYLPNEEHTYLLPTNLLIIWFHEYFDTTNLRNLMLLFTFTVLTKE